LSNMSIYLQLVECIRPILPMIRNTPYGKRIQSKLQREQMGGGHQDHYSGGGGSSSGGGGGGGNSNYGGGGGMMSLGGNMHSNNYMGGHNGGGHGGRGGYQSHPRHLGHHSMHHPNALSEVYGQHQQGMGGYGGYQNGMGAYQNGMGFDPMARGQFGGQEHNHGPQFGAQAPGGFAPNAAESNFSPAGFAAVPVNAQAQPENGNLAGMMPLENANVGGYPQQGYAPYM
jgi:hypothetical protein